MCKFCEKNSNIKHESDIKTQITIDKDHLEYYIGIYNWNTSMEIPIKYCPMCGEKLIVNKKDNESKT